LVITSLSNKAWEHQVILGNPQGQSDFPDVGGGQAAILIFLNRVTYFLCCIIKYLFFSLCFRSRGGILFELEGGDVAEDLDGIDFDDLEALANAGQV
jgi:hypothetical protein